MMAAKSDISKLFDKRHMVSAYGKCLCMLHTETYTADEWLSDFTRLVRENLGKSYMPVYRMADGEFIFMFGFRWNWRHKNPLWSLASYLKYQCIWYLGRGFKTSWGETYSRQEIAEMRKLYCEGIAKIINEGMVCPFLYETGNRQYQSHKWEAFRFFAELGGGKVSRRVFPFHFPFLLMANSVGNEAHVLQRRKVLVVSGLDAVEQNTVQESLHLIGAEKVSFLRISKSKSMFDRLPGDSEARFGDCEIALVAAGIGSLNVIRQMTWFNGPVIDVGGFMRCLKERNFIYHGGACRFPEIN